MRRVGGKLTLSYEASNGNSVRRADAAPNPLHDVAIVGAYNTRQARVLEQPRPRCCRRNARRAALAASPRGRGRHQRDVLRTALDPREVVQLLGGGRLDGVEIGIPA